MILHFRLLKTLALLVAGASGLQAQVTRTNTFDVDPNWTAVGVGINGNAFGYSATSNAGGTTGEIGGHFTRTTAVRSYADTSGISLALNGAFFASGRFDFTHASTPDFGPGLQIGHFAINGTAGVGIMLNNNNTGALHWSALIRLADGTELSSTPTPLASNVDRLWNYNWDPTGGINGSGRLSVTMSGESGGGTQYVDITPSQFAIGGNFDAFGFNSEAAVSSNLNRSADLYLDDVTYVVNPVPEPSSGFLAGTLALGSFHAIRSSRVRSRRKL